MPLQQRQRVAVRLGHDPVTHLGVQRHPRKRAEQSHRVPCCQTPQNKFGQPGEVGVDLSSGDDQTDRVGQ